MPDDQPRNVPALAEPRQSAPATVGELFRREDATIKRLSAVALRYLPAERAAHLAISAVRKVPDLAKCSPASFMGSLMAATGLGLEPNTPRNHSWLIPYRRRRRKRDQNGRFIMTADEKYEMEEWYECQLQIGYEGFVELMGRAKISVQAEAVYDVDDFHDRIGSHASFEFEKALERREGQIRFRDREAQNAKNWLSPDNPDRFDFSPGLEAAFCYVRRIGYPDNWHTMTYRDLLRSRARSQAWNTARRDLEQAESERKTGWQLSRAQTDYAETPWVAWEPPMAAKSAIRAMIKLTSLGDDQALATKISLAADMDALGDAGLVDISRLEDPEVAKAVIGTEKKAGSGELPDQEPDSEQGGNEAGADAGRPAETAGSGGNESETTEAGKGVVQDDPANGADKTAAPATGPKPPTEPKPEPKDVW